MDKDALEQDMREHMGDEDAPCFQPLEMDRETVCAWISLGLAKVADMAEEISQHVDMIGGGELFGEDESGNAYPHVRAAAEEFGEMFRAVHAIGHVLGQKLMDEDQRAEQIKRNVEIQVGQPVRLIEREDGGGYVIELQDVTIPPNLEGLF